MSESEISMVSSTTWDAASEHLVSKQNGKNVREVVLEGLDKETKNSIIEYMIVNHLDVKGLDQDTFAVDLSKWHHSKRNQFVDLLKSIGGTCPDEMDGNHTSHTTSLSEVQESDFTKKQVSSRGSDFGEESDDYPETVTEFNVNSVEMERRFPIQPHPEEELDFEYLRKNSVLPQPAPIYQKDELLHVKPMIMSEETRSTMGSAEVGYKTGKKSTFTALVACLLYPFKFIKRVKIRRFFKKHSFLRKYKEERMKKEKAFAVYSSLLQEGPRMAREFRQSLKKDPAEGRRTIGTNTVASFPIGNEDDFSMTSGGSRAHIGVNAVTKTKDAEVNTRARGLYWDNSHFPQAIPWVFSEPEVEIDHWCPCQAFASSNLSRCLTYCLKSICGSDSQESMEQDIQHQKVQLEEVRNMLSGALDLLGTVRSKEEDSQDSIKSE